MSAGCFVWFAAGAPGQELLEAASTLIFGTWLVIVIMASVVSLGALCAVLPSVLPDKVQASAQRSASQPGRSTLFGAVNVAGGLVVAAGLARAGQPFGLIAVAIVSVLAYFALVGLAGIGGIVAQTVSPGREIGPLQAGTGGVLLGLGCVFPILGQVFAVLCLCCAVGSAISSARGRL